MKRQGARWEGQPERWRAFPAGEQTLLTAVAGMLRSAKPSQVREGGAGGSVVRAGNQMFYQGAVDPCTPESARG